MFGAVLKLGASARIWRCSCASLPVERRPISPDFPPLSTTMDNQGFFASKGSVCWSLLVPAPSLFASWIAVSTPRITRCRGVPAVHPFTVSPPHASFPAAASRRSQPCDTPRAVRLPRSALPPPSHSGPFQRSATAPAAATTDSPTAKSLPLPPARHTIGAPTLDQASISVSTARGEATHARLRDPGGERQRQTSEEDRRAAQAAAERQSACFPVLN